MSEMRAPISRGGIAGVGHAAHAHHVAALLQVGVRVEQVVADVLEDRLDLLAGELVERDVRIGDGGLVHQVLGSDRLRRAAAWCPSGSPGENAISAPLTAISASRISWSKVPLKLPRR